MNPMVTFDTDPDHYAHWRVKIDGAVATLVLDVDEDRGLKPGYKLKLNSYDLGVDIELADALQRLRFEHPEVHCLVITSGKERMFCSGANIYMLGASSHAWKVNFCKFTNETRNGIEDASLYSGLKSIAALNGTTAGGGYELALACDEILMIDDRSSTVSLPEVPLLAVLPGTGGLTRLTDKRKLRRDLADVFCTTIEGVRADRAKAWGLVDAIATPSTFGDTLARRAKELAAEGVHSQGVTPRGIVLTPLKRTVSESGIGYPNLDVALDRAARVATFTLRAPSGPTPDSIEAITAQGADWWPLALARELDDAMLLLRTNALDIGTWVMRTAGDPAAVLAVDATLTEYAGHWLVRETTGLWRRTLSRLDVSARSVFALIDRGSCFAGTLLELALAADRGYMLALPDERDAEPAIALSAQTYSAYPMCNGRTRLANRFAVDTLAPEPEGVGTMLHSEAAREAGLVTFTPDDIDWDDEIRLALEERASLSPDALSGMEASLRFSGPETMHARIFGRLAAWQNWVFQRPNAVGKDGALKLFGSGTRAKFDWERV
ncbi:MAG TPA: 2,3-epoxybenzoyl-CoA dihydrolase [Casimicrobiaceae bacterium]|nr:2,3-epoxybenzoyl-CoA dihydrolase [Casimicrobiaceae bacterium]